MKHLGLLILALLLALGNASAAAKPNFVVLFVDDFGWGDMHFQREKFDMPNLDRLMRDSMTLRRHARR